MAPADSTRVLVLSWEYPPLIEGGLARAVRNLCDAMVERGKRSTSSPAAARSRPRRRR